MANEESVPFWRLREIQALVAWLRQSDTKLIDTGAMDRWLDRQQDGPWWSLLRVALEEYGLETGGAELPIGHFLDWLAEWGREARRRQTGLLLLTAHRAKGLEFDHVAVLDGAWEKVGKGDDRDAPRRLYYVAMTRARKTLTLARLARGNGLLDPLPADASILKRELTDLPPPPQELERRYMPVSLGDLDLGFAGRYRQDHPVHREIAGLSPGDPIRLEEHDGKWELRAPSGHVVGRMAGAFSPAKGMAFSSGEVAAILTRRREDESEEFQDRVRCERWELVVPELVFMPLASSS
jgi:ATP-dependent DNA helicase RecQ